MLAELSMTLLGRGTQLSGDLGRILKIIDESGIRYKLTPSGTCLEGEWDEVMDLIKKMPPRGPVILHLRLNDGEN
jgi:uncharacterized protein YqgV (UPF0045/DUF77 family)